ncbi:hypothetical protein L6Q21_09975 [Sandaracinobacter sp. RS1-74]|uniref:hypothetical protein n=1 Tax=Sandaracinobacteroides sayramensis TaxID=2913411 RepID=UPI001EDAE215|nr:hypothetical protein [Sandaracinobacteroides sayramensis]MCG2841308.1 hypothetical protein [Sandaracinobacteroides sayramensis]
MSRSLPPNRAQSLQPSRSARHGPLEKAVMRAVGTAAAPPPAAVPPTVSAAARRTPEMATAPVASPPVVAALTTFEGQAVFRVLKPGSPDFQAGDLFRFRFGSRSMGARPW